MVGFQSFMTCGFFGCNIDHASHNRKYFTTKEGTVGPGWQSMLNTLSTWVEHDMANPRHDTMLGASPYENFKVAQVKQKFGRLRIYVDGGTEELQFIINFLEELSATICEKCGAPGQLVMDPYPSGGGWVYTACKEHQSEKAVTTF